MIYQLTNTDLLKWLKEQESRCGIIHQANCFHTMGSGIAKGVREQFPEAYAADKKTKYGSQEKLGTFSVAQVNGGYKFVYNIYGQWKFGGRIRNTSYDALETGLRAIVDHAFDNNLTMLGLPYNIGCGLGGGNWEIVKAIIGTIFTTESIDLYICKYDAI
jgi:O-acetyl-ADP-ribose deacetylase (regulator of RNase III)